MLNAFVSDDALSGLLNLDLSFLNSMWFVWINMVFIIFVLAWLLYKPLLNFLENRRERIKNEIESAAENFRKSEEAKATYDAKLSGIARERDEILDTAKKTAQAQETEIIAAAKNEAGLIMERARRDIEQEREKARDEMRRQIVQVSALMAERLMGGQLTADGATRDRLLNQAIAELGAVEWKS
ncbi:MAG: F0F1 ATP synthase subunit B [Clostridiales bacterium]|jgi:F-type H+-transporting ATPase subunit b|nr:F0F1 ATP synthase subunit B [Clostridiales bacterium]